MSVIATLNRWLNRSPVTSSDLSIYRVLYSLFVLFTLYRADYAAALPPSSLEPLPGPFFAIPGSLPLGLIWLAQVALCGALAMLLVGWHTRFSAIAVGVLQICVYGIGYSFGKIDHTIFLPFVALIFAFAPWSARFSVDSQSSRGSGERYPWAPRCLAVGLGIGMLTAGLPKVVGGWLDWGSHASYGYLVLEKDVFNAPLRSLEYLSEIHLSVLWECVDYATVVLECGLFFAALNWRVFYHWIAALAVFHFAIALSAGIVFPYNIPAYAAFVPWSRVPLLVAALEKVPTAWVDEPIRRLTFCAALAFSFTVLAWLRPAQLVPLVYVAIIALGALAGSAYLTWSAAQAATGVRRRVRGSSGG